MEPRDLNLHGIELGSIPEWVWDQVEGRELLLAENHLSEMSPLIGKMAGLRTLDLGHNELEQVPEELGELVELSDFLYLHDNKLKTLPASLAYLTKLRYLNIGENPMSELPSCVLSMSALVELRLSKTAIMNLPESIGDLRALKELHLRDCYKLESLPTSIGSLNELRVLDLRGTGLRALPAEVDDLPELHKLDLRWTAPMLEVPPLQKLRARGCLVYR